MFFHCRGLSINFIFSSRQPFNYAPHSFLSIFHTLHYLIVHFARFHIDLDVCCFTMESLLYLFNSVIRWIRLKIYQYEVTFAVYMLTPTEKFIFSMSAF